jgi:hypothetical protein
MTRPLRTPRTARPATRRAEDFEKEEAKLRAKLDGREGENALPWLVELEADWARALVKAKPSQRTPSVITAIRAVAKRGIEPSLVLEASKHLAKAEHWQAEYAAGATGGGEGLGRSYALTDLMLARAWLLAGAAELPSIRKQGRELCSRLERRRNMLPAQRRELDALKQIFK